MLKDFPNEPFEHLMKDFPQEFLNESIGKELFEDFTKQYSEKYL